MSTRTGRVGSVASGSRENWGEGSGSQYLPGESTSRGDIALATVSPGRSATGRVDRGGPVHIVSGRGVIAKGVISGAGGRSDSYGGRLDPCAQVFTDIYQPYYCLPGSDHERMNARTGGHREDGPGRRRDRHGRPHRYRDGHLTDWLIPA